MRVFLLAALASVAASAQQLPCQMDPKFRGAYCDDPAYLAATKVYQACVAQHGNGSAAGYTCNPVHPKAAVDCSQAERCRADPSIGTASQAEYDAVWEQYRQCTASVPPPCGVPAFPARAGVRAQPVAPLKHAPAAAPQPAPAVPAAKGSAPSYPGYGQFGQAMVNSVTQGGGAAAPQPAPAAAGQGPAPAPAPSQPRSFMPQYVAEPAPAPQPSAAPVFAPIGSGNNSDTQQWMQRQREQMRKSKPAKKKVDSGDSDDSD